MAVPTLVDAQWLVKNLGNVRIIDASYTPTVPLAPAEYKEKYYGKFGSGINDFKNKEFLADHINGASHFNFDIAYYPTETERFALYPPAEFSAYIKRLGVYNGDHIVLYARGPEGGFPNAARAYWTFKYYNYQSVSILNGGLDAFKLVPGGVCKGGEELISCGNFEVTGTNDAILVKADAVPFGSLSSIKFLDARRKEGWIGKENLPFPNPEKPTAGFRVKDSIHFPLSNVVGPKGLKKKVEVEQAFGAGGIAIGNKVITHCAFGVRAAALYVALEVAGIPAAVYNGGYYEIVRTKPELVTEK